MISVDEALGRILAAFARLDSETVPLDEALGRVLSGPLEARVTQPPADLSAMDGYAVRAADVAKVPVELTIIGEVPAGAPFEGTVGPGEAARIFTGGAVPEGADSIVIQENAKALDGGRVRIEKASPQGRHIRLKGFDFAAGETVLEAGQRLGSRELALSAAANFAAIEVSRRPRVAVLSTGSELRPPGDDLAPGEIANSNAPLLGAMIERRGGIARDLGTVGDDPGELTAALEGLEGVEALVTIGGASVGDYDLVQETLSGMGFTLDFWKVGMKPGKPLIFGDYSGVPMIGMPGNPVSAAVCAVVFLLPALDKMQGATQLGIDPVAARLAGELPANGPRQAYLRAGLAAGADGAPEAAPFALQDSSALKSFAAAGCLIIRPPDAPALATGAVVPILPLTGI